MDRILKEQKQSGSTSTGGYISVDRQKFLSDNWATIKKISGTTPKHNLLEEEIIELIRQLITFGRSEDKIGYRKARKELKRLSLENVEARSMIRDVLGGVKLP